MAGRPIRWVGDVFAWDGATNADTGSDLIPALSLNVPAVSTLDSVVRVLVDWTFHSQIEGSATGLEKQPEPWAMAVYYTPLPPGDPDTESSSISNALMGDALYSEVLHWVPTPIWDGTQFSNQWHASSNGVRDGHGKRTIHDKTTAKVHFGISPLRSFVPTESLLIPMTLKGLMRIKVAVSKF